MTSRQKISDKERAVRLRLRDDFEHYAKKVLKLRTKAGKVEPVILNKAQKYIHDKLENQLDRTGKIRALVLKGRQQGVSTYVAARFYHKTSHRRGVRTFILTHEDAASANLFDIVNRYHEHCHPLVKPSTGAANAKELYFDRLDSGYKVGTAGTKGVGRSSTIQLFHGSEAGFWPHAESHMAGLLQAIPDAPGTEAILESTANGVGNLFHQLWQEAEAGASEWMPIFVPWFWQEEYRADPGPDFKLTDEEIEYGEQHGLDYGQLAWRRKKITELRDADLFAQEYPATAADAFRLSGHDSFIPSPLVMRARKAVHVPTGPLIVGFDPAWMGSDRSVMAWRQGRKVIKYEAKSQIDTMQSAGWCKQVLDNDRPARMFIDVGGVGAGVYDRLCEMGYVRKIRAVNFGSSPLEPGPALNRRAEMWMNAKKWLEDEGGADLPDEDELQADACAPSYKYDSLTRLVLESKADMRKRGVRSPDVFDAIALTFAEFVPPALAEEYERDSYRRAEAKSKRGRTNSWMTA
jgi:hypothetical protein